MKTLTKKKNFLLLGAGMLSLAVAGSVGAITASAATISGPTDTGTATVTYTENSGWTIQIPETITVNTPAQIQASDVNIAGDSLVITVNSKNNFKLKNEGETDEIGYTLKVAAQQDGLTEAGALTQNGTVLTVTGDSGSTYIGAYVDGNPSTAGEAYTDTLTFTIAEN